MASRHLLSALVLVLWTWGVAEAEPAATAVAVGAESATVLLEKGIYQEETVGDLDAAMKTYQQVADQAKAVRGPAAQALYRLGLCHLKKGQKDQAAAAFRQVVELYGEQKDLAAKAQAELAKRGAAKSNAPLVVRTAPATLANDVDPALDTITVTFNQKMRDKSWAWVQRYPDKYPHSTGGPCYDEARTTCALPVKLEPGKVYWVEFNSPPFVGFVSESREPAQRYALVFATKGADGKPTPLPEELVKQAKEINAAAATADKTVQLKAWVEDFFKHNYRDVTARETVEWGQPETDTSGNLSIRYKYLATIWDKDKLVIEDLFTFTTEGKYVSVKKLSSTPSVSAADKKEGETLAAEAWRLWNEQKFAEAEARFTLAVAKDPGSANAWNGLGWARMNQGKSLNAREAFEKAVAIESGRAGALNGLGWIAKNEGKVDEAVAFWKKALASAPEATAALNGLASTCLERGQYDAALAYYEQWFKAEPGSAEAKAGLAQTRQTVEAVKSALSVAETWLKLVDEAKYAESWEAGAEFFRKGVTKEQFVQQLSAVRPSLGKVVSRKATSQLFAKSLPGAPDGEYVVIQFETTFENKKQGVETVTPMKDKDGLWRVSGYFVK